MCFSLGWFQQLLVFLVVVCVIVGIIKVLVPYIVSKLGATVGEGMNVLVRICTLILWGVVAIFVIYVAFALISCLLSYSGGFPLLPHR